MSLAHSTINCAREGCYAVITLHPQEEDRLRNTHETFYCPAGHSNYYPGKTAQEKELDKLRRSVEVAENWWREWRDRWEAEHDRCRQLAHSMQVCPLGCGWRSARRLPWEPDGGALHRFLDRAGSDLAEHLLREHNATRAPVALLTAGEDGAA